MKAISIIALTMVMVWLGAYGSQCFIWTAPIQVVPLTNSITTGTLSAAVDNTSSENFGSHPTTTTAAMPASDNVTRDNAIIILQENSIIHFAATDEDAGILDNHFQSLTVNICVYGRGRVNAPVADNLNLYVVVNGMGQTDIENQTAVRSADNDWDAIFTVSYTTLGSTATGYIAINVYAVEGGANSGSGGRTYKWKVPYQITAS